MESFDALSIQDLKQVKGGGLMPGVNGMMPGVNGMVPGVNAGDDDDIIDTRFGTMGSGSIGLSGYSWTG